MFLGKSYTGEGGPLCRPRQGPDSSCFVTCGGAAGTCEQRLFFLSFLFWMKTHIFAATFVTCRIAGPHPRRRANAFRGGACCEASPRQSRRWPFISLNCHVTC